ncbi:hypothetical protein HZA87_06195 [Candidatus Uhrbacteria bacterium]|nr:hypothetical protein [Candidatus Uhrbacteria bacterium]
MKKLIASTAAALVLSGAVLTPAFAQSSASSSAGSSSSVTASVDLACMSAAIEARENAVISARTTFHAAIMAALNTRKDALKAAFTISNDHDRQVAINAAWDAFMKAVVNARAKYKTDINAAWTAFFTASVNCKVAPDRGPVMKNKDKDHDDKDKKNGNRGLHLGWFRKALRLGTSADADAKVKVNNYVKSNVKANADFDLSF